MDRYKKAVKLLTLFLLFTLILITPLFSAPGNVTLQLRNPEKITLTSYTSESELVVTGTLSIRHRNAAVDIAFGFGSGNSLDHYSRFAVDNKNNSINYNVYNNLTERKVVTDRIENGDIAADWYFTDSYPESKNPIIYSYKFAVVVPADQFPETSTTTTYSDTLSITLFSITEGAYTLEDDKKTLSLSIQVDTIAQIAVGPPGFTNFEPGNLHSLDLGEIVLNKTAAFDTVVKSNAPYSIEVSSLYSGKLRKSFAPSDDAEVVDYTLAFNGGSPVPLDVTTVVVDGAPATTVEGDRYSSIITITDTSKAVTPGDYVDTISLTVTAQ